MKIIPNPLTYHLAVDALIVAIETQADYLASKKTWTRKIVLVTDGESPIEMEDWDAIVQKMNDLNVSLTLVCVFKYHTALIGPDHIIEG